MKAVVLTGESAPRLYETAAKVGYENAFVASDFEIAVKVAALIAKSGEAVLLSPACSSYDRFSNFEERGDEFIRIVDSL